MKIYVFRIITAGVVCAIACAMFHKNDALSRLIKMLSGLFMLITILLPLSHLDLNIISFVEPTIQSDGLRFAESGSLQAQESLRGIITERCQSYIVEKASSMGVSVDVEVSLNDETYPKPCAVKIRGTVSPYTKTRLQTIISQDLGIPKEQQRWV